MGRVFHGLLSGHAPPFVGLGVSRAEWGRGSGGRHRLVSSLAIVLRQTQCEGRNTRHAGRKPHMARSTPEQLAASQHRYRALAEAIADIEFISAGSLTHRQTRCGQTELPPPRRPTLAARPYRVRRDIPLSRSGISWATMGSAGGGGQPCGRRFVQRLPRLSRSGCCWWPLRAGPHRRREGQYRPRR